jgi:hypothetical protein
LNAIAKMKVTKTQLNDLILERLGFAAFLTIHPETKEGLGYTAGVVTAPERAIRTQEVVDSIVAELRPDYELVDG